MAELCALAAQPKGMLLRLTRADTDTCGPIPVVREFFPCCDRAISRVSEGKAPPDRHEALADGISEHGIAAANHPAHDPTGPSRDPYASSDHGASPRLH